MNRKSRMMIIFLTLLVGSLSGNAVQAAGLCSSESMQALPAHMSKLDMLRINAQVGLGQVRAKSLQATKPKGFEHYQKPILIDKGTCTYKENAFNQSTIKM